MFTILKFLGSTTPHLSNRVVTYYVVSCMTPTMFDWCSSLLDTIRGKLTGSRMRRINKFRFGSLICSYFFERILALSISSTTSSSSLRATDGAMV